MTNTARHVPRTKKYLGESWSISREGLYSLHMQAAEKPQPESTEILERSAPDSRSNPAHSQGQVGWGPKKMSGNVTETQDMTN